MLPLQHLIQSLENKKRNKPQDILKVMQSGDLPFWQKEAFLSLLSPSSFLPQQCLEDSSQVLVKQGQELSHIKATSKSTPPADLFSLHTEWAFSIVPPSQTQQGKALHHLKEDISCFAFFPANRRSRTAVVHLAGSTTQREFLLHRSHWNEGNCTRAQGCH